MLVLLAFGIGFFTFLMKAVYGYVGENLTFTIRKMLFAGIIYKHISWFDSKDKAPGVLTNILSENITEVNGLSTETLSVMLEAFLAIIIGIVLALAFSWQVALITIGFAPFLFLGAVLMARL